MPELETTDVNTARTEAKCGRVCARPVRFRSVVRRRCPRTGASSRSDRAEWSTIPCVRPRASRIRHRLERAASVALPGPAIVSEMTSSALPCPGSMKFNTFDVGEGFTVGSECAPSPGPRTAAVVDPVKHRRRSPDCNTPLSCTCSAGVIVGWCFRRDLVDFRFWACCQPSGGTRRVSS